MPRYFIHLINAVGIAPDEEGTEAPDLDAVRERALQGIRSIISDEAKVGKIDLRGRAEIADQTGRILLVLPFAEAFNLCTEDPPG